MSELKSEALCTDRQADTHRHTQTSLHPQLYVGTRRVCVHQLISTRPRKENTHCSSQETTALELTTGH